MCTRISGQGSSGGNKHFALGYLVSVLLVGIFLGGMSQGNPLGDLVHVYCFCERQFILSCMSHLSCFIFFYFLTVLVITICHLELFP